MTINEIRNEVRFFTKTDATSFPDADLIRCVNRWYVQVVSWIWRSVGTWEYDDRNHPTLSIGTAHLRHEQQDYELPVNAQKVDRVEVLGSDGNWKKLNPIDKSQIGIALAEYRKTAGMPLEYDLIGRSVMLYPRPSRDNVILVKGLRIYVSRNVIKFRTTDTTKEPGFVEGFHRILSLGTSMDYCIANELRTKELNFRRQIFGGETTTGLKRELQKFYGTRHREFRTRLRPQLENYE